MKIKVLSTIALFVFINQPLFTGNRFPAEKSVTGYNITVRFVPAEKSIVAVMEATWRNNTKQEADLIKMHLYMNGFNGSNTLFSREARFNKSDRTFRMPINGGIEIESIKIKGGKDLIKKISIYETVMTIPLERPVKPDETITLEIGFKVKIPSPKGFRTGTVDDYFLVSGWFPKFGVFENGAWNCRQFHWLTEFYSDFGDYHVEITAPSQYILGGTGIKKSIEIDEKTRKWVFDATRVVDFAWTASPDFILVRDHHRNIEIELLLQKFHRGSEQQHITALKKAIDGYAELCGDYPYPKITVVDPYPGSGTDGMEYPMFFTAGTGFYDYKVLVNGYSPKAVIIHEFGHQYFYNLLATDEQAEGWLDEGFTTYTENKVVGKYYSVYRKFSPFKYILSNSLDNFFPIPSSFKKTYMGQFDYFFLGKDIYPFFEERLEFLRRPGIDSIAAETYKTFDYESSIINAYNKPALLLETLGNIAGKERMLKFIRSYSAEYRFKHPKKEQVLEIAKRELGSKAYELFVRFIYSNGTVDYAVTDIISMPEPERTKGNDNPGLPHSTPLFRSMIAVERLGNIDLPIEILAVFEDGRRWKYEWNPYEKPGREPVYNEWDEFNKINGKSVMLREGEDHSWLKIYFLDKSKLILGEVDPGYKILLDINLVNNSCKVKPESGYAIGLGARLLNNFFGKLYALMLLN